LTRQLVKEPPRKLFREESQVSEKYGEKSSIATMKEGLEETERRHTFLALWADVFPGSIAVPR